MGEVLQAELHRLAERFSDRIGAVHGKGLVAGVQMVKAGSIEPDGEAALQIIRRCVEMGLLMFSPVGFGGATVKIAPPLVITEEAVREGAGVLEDAMTEVLTS